MNFKRYVPDFQRKRSMKMKKSFSISVFIYTNRVYFKQQNQSIFLTFSIRIVFPVELQGKLKIINNLLINSGPSLVALSTGIIGLIIPLIHLLLNCLLLILAEFLSASNHLLDVLEGIAVFFEGLWLVALVWVVPRHDCVVEVWHILMKN